MSKTATSGVLSVVAIMAVTSVYLTRHSRSSGPLAEPDKEMTTKDVYNFSSSELGDDGFLYEISDIDFIRREKVKEVRKF